MRLCNLTKQHKAKVMFFMNVYIGGCSGEDSVINATVSLQAEDGGYVDGKVCIEENDYVARIFNEALDEFEKDGPEMPFNTCLHKATVRLVSQFYTREGLIAELRENGVLIEL